LTANGRPVTAQDFRGKVVALYFGYTHCPDVCPATLANLADTLGKVGSPDVRVLFVTVDPEHDADAVMADYAKAFSPQVVGFRGHDKFQICIAAPSAASTASCIISDRVGCGKMVCANSWSVSSPVLATT